MYRFGLIGRPLGHSRSAELFAERFAREGIDACYELHELACIDELPDLLMRYPDLVGLNVTAPYKTEVLAYADTLSPEVETIGAANVLLIDRSSKGGYRIEAYNSDVYGFEASLYPHHTQGTAHALILGTGGAARAVAYALEHLGIDYLYVSRSPRLGQIGYDEVAHYLETSQLIVNATPVGYSLGEAPAIPYDLLGPRHLCYDLIYNPAETAFLAHARRAGAKTHNGLDMLRLQAEQAWAIWANHYY